MSDSPGFARTQYLPFLRRAAGRGLVFLLALALALGGFAPALAAPGATITVNTASDVFDVAGEDCGTVQTGDLAGEISLREAICAANNTAGGPHTIQFNIPDGGVQTIAVLTAALPVIGSPMTIDAATQPGYSGKPLVVLDGANLTAGDGLTLGAGSTTLRGLGVVNFPDNGILISSDAGSADGNRIYGCHIGVDANGSLAQPNGMNGVQVLVGSDNWIGGSASGEGNLISGNGGAGVSLWFGANNRVSGNKIGANFAGSAALPNQGSGVEAWWSHQNTIGGSASGAGNLISGNAGVGLYLGDAAFNQVLGNKIGTDAGGSLAVGNCTVVRRALDPQGGGGGAAITLLGAQENQIGGAAAGEGNLISGNACDAIYLGLGSDFNQVLGNKIGTNLAGALALKNAGTGISFYQAGNNTIGGAAAGAGNLISANQGFGLYLYGKKTTANFILGNRIGTNASGGAALGNGMSGIYLYLARGNTIGGTAPGEGNLISANEKYGVHLAGWDTSSNALLGNKIGTDLNGSQDLGNALDGVRIFNGKYNAIGGSAAGAGNLISGNDQHGVAITGDTARWNTLQGNKIGTNNAGSAALGNGFNGVLIYDALKNTVGGGAAGQGNLVSANGGYGVVIAGSLAFENKVQGNKIGVDLAGSAGLGNAYGGVAVQDGFANLIGGASAGQGNLISANGGSGVRIAGTLAAANDVLNNTIGANLAGSAGLGNAAYGVEIAGGSGTFLKDNVIVASQLDGVRVGGASATGNGLYRNSIGVTASGVPLGNRLSGVSIDGAGWTTLGLDDPAWANTIAYNQKDGVTVLGSGANNALAANAIYANGELGIDLGNDGVTPNDALDADGGPNLLQNFPLIQVASVTGNTVSLSGVLNSVPNQPYTLYFFSSPACDISGYGEGQSYLGSLAVDTDPSGSASFNGSFTLPAGPSQFVTAIAVGNSANASEFSPCKAARMAMFLPVVLR